MELAARKIKNIVVAIDFSKKSAFILEKAAALAKSTQSKLTILHVIQKKTADNSIEKLLAESLPLDLWLSTEEYIANLLQEKINKLVPHKLAVNTVLIYKGNPAKKILQYIRKNKVDLLILGAHGRYSMRDFFVGTTTQQVTKKISCPLLIIKNKSKLLSPQILVPIDFSDTSKNALNFAIRLFPDTKPQLIHVCDNEYQDLLEREENKISKDKLGQIKKIINICLDNQMKKFIKGYRKKLAKPAYYIQMGYPAYTIAYEAHKKNKHLIVMGTQGHGSQFYLFLGSVANRVINETDKDILLVPPKK